MVTQRAESLELQSAPWVVPAMGGLHTADGIRRVLIVEDEVLVRFAVAEYLRDCGFEVVEAANAAEAIEVLSSVVEIHLVFTDVEMPGELNGIELARWVTSNHPQVKVLVTSGGHRMAEEAQDLCLAEGFLTKPVAFEELAELIDRLLASKRES